MDIDIVKRFIYGAKEAYKKVDNHSYNFPITIESAYRLATNIETLLKEQEAVEPREQEETRTWIVCGNCSQHLISKWLYCPYCGRKVKWDE